MSTSPKVPKAKEPEQQNLETSIAAECPNLLYQYTTTRATGTINPLRMNYEKSYIVDRLLQHDKLILAGQLIGAGSPARAYLHPVIPIPSARLEVDR